METYQHATTLKYTKYLGITYVETKAVEILEQQFITYQQENGQFCSMNAPLQPLANPPSCIATMYAKNKAGIDEKMFTMDQDYEQCHHPNTNSF